METQKMNENEKISLGEMIAYGMGGFGRGIINSTAMGILNYFYTNSLGMSAAVVGMVFMLSRIFDGATDVAVGVLVDKTKSKLGKARSWLVWCSVPFGAVTFLLFTVPDVSAGAKLIYVIVTYNLVTSVFGTLFYVPHMTLSALITRDKVSRNNLTIVNQILSMLAGLIPSMVLLPAALSRNNTQSAWIQVMLIGSIMSVIPMLICFFGTKERVHESGTAKKSDIDGLGIISVVKILFANKYWLMVLGLFIFDAMSNNFFYASVVYYCQYILGDAKIFSNFSLANTGFTMLGLFIAPMLLKKYNKQQIFMAGALIKTVSLAAVIFNPGSVMFFLLCRSICAFGIGLNYATMYAFVPDTMEYGQWKTGVRLEGTLQSACSIGAKIGVGFGPGIVGIVMAATGYDGTLAVQAESALTGIRLCTIWAPAIFAAIMTFIMAFYDLDKKYDSIIAELQERKVKAGNE